MASRLAPVVLTTVCLLAIVGPAAFGPGGVAAAQSAATNPCVGTMERVPDGPTVVSVQGIAFEGDRYVKRPALAVGFGPTGGLEYAYNATARDRFWAYDVDPLPSGRLLVATTEPRGAVAETLDPTTGERVRVRRFDHDPNVTVATDIDWLPGGNLLVADGTPGREGVRVYDPRAGAAVWNWTFGGDGGYRRAALPGNGVGVNDADRVAPGSYLVTARALDRVVLVNRSTDEVALGLGANGSFRTLDRPANPQLLRTDDGRVALLVADGGNDRVVGYIHTPGESSPASPGGENWTLTWELVGGGLNEPRDADRLPSGNTLVVDRRGHRVMEVTPRGRVVWEVYAPWQPYDAERVAPGDEPGGPAATSFGANRTVALTNSAAFDRGRVADCAAALLAFAPTREERLLGAFGVNASGGGPPATGGGPGAWSLALGGAGVAAVALAAGYLLRE